MWHVFFLGVFSLDNDWKCDFGNYVLFEHFRYFIPQPVVFPFCHVFWIKVNQDFFPCNYYPLSHCWFKSRYQVLVIILANPTLKYRNCFTDYLSLKYFIGSVLCLKGSFWIWVSFCVCPSSHPSVCLKVFSELTHFFWNSAWYQSQ